MPLAYRIIGLLLAWLILLVMLMPVAGHSLNPTPSLEATLLRNRINIIYRVDINRGIYFPVDTILNTHLLSPNGTQGIRPVSENERLHLYIKPTDVPEYHLGTFDIFTLPNRITWSRDSRSVYIVSMRRKDTPFYLYKVDIASGQQQPIGEYHLPFTPTDLRVSVGGEHLQLCEGIGNFRQCALINLSMPHEYSLISQRHSAIAPDDTIRAEISIIAGEFLWEFEEFRLHDIPNQTSQKLSLHELPAMPKAPLYWSQDGQYLAMAATGAGIVVYDHQVDAIRLVEGDFTLLTDWSSDNQLLLYMNATETIAVWDAMTDTIRNIVTPTMRGNITAYNYLWTENAAYMLALDGKQLYILDMRRNRLVQTGTLPNLPLRISWYDG